MLSSLQLAEQLDLLAGSIRGKNADKVRAALRLAEKKLREDKKKRPMSEDAVRLMIGNLERGMEFAVYVEDRGYYKPMPALLDRAYNDTIRVLYSNGMYYMLEMKDYGRTWRLWDTYPSGVEMKMAEWRARK